MQEFHEVSVKSAEAALSAIKDTGFFELMQDLEKASEEDDQARALELMGEMAKLEDTMSEWEDKMSELEADIERTKQDLSPTTHEILADADCF